MGSHVNDFDSYISSEQLDVFSTGYHDWLVGRIDGAGHGILMDILHDTPFDWIMERDSDRAEHGKYLRVKYAEETGQHIDSRWPDWSDWPCSMLEMLVGLAEALEDHVLYDSIFGDRTAVWFWMMLSNCGLAGLDDETILSNGVDVTGYIQSVCERITNREYGYSGEGGLFPLEHPGTDQRDVEIWYQAQSYILENHLV